MKIALFGEKQVILLKHIGLYEIRDNSNTKADCHEKHI